MLSILHLTLYVGSVLGIPLYWNIAFIFFDKSIPMVFHITDCFQLKSAKIPWNTVYTERIMVIVLITSINQSAMPTRSRSSTATSRRWITVGRMPSPDVPSSEMCDKFCVWGDRIATTNYAIPWNNSLVGFKWSCGIQRFSHSSEFYPILICMRTMEMFHMCLLGLGELRWLLWQWVSAHLLTESSASLHSLHSHVHPRSSHGVLFVTLPR